MILNEEVRGKLFMLSEMMDAHGTDIYYVLMSDKWRIPKDIKKTIEDNLDKKEYVVNFIRETIDASSKVVLLSNYRRKK